MCDCFPFKNRIFQCVNSKFDFNPSLNLSCYISVIIFLFLHFSRVRGKMELDYLKLGVKTLKIKCIPILIPKFITEFYDRCLPPL